MDRPLINPGTLFWTGQHWVNYIRLPGAETDSAMVNLWHTHRCAAGEGTMAFVHIPGEGGVHGIFADRPAIAEFIRTWMKGRGGVYDRTFPVFEANFRREGDVLSAPSWVIESERHQIIAAWGGLREPVILDGPAPKFAPNRDVYSLLFFAESAQILLNGHLIPGAPYLRDIWKSSIGGDRNSCVFALSETFIDIAG